MPDTVNTMNLNKVLIVGRVTANPELRKTAQGTSVTSFGVATNRVWNDAGGAKKEDTEFHNVVAWGRSAEVAAQFLSKGGLVLVEGRLQTRSWQDKQGVNHKTTEIICERLQLGPKSSSVVQGNRGEFSGTGTSSNSAIREKTEDIPVIDMDAESGGDEVPF